MNEAINALRAADVVAGGIIRSESQGQERRKRMNTINLLSADLDDGTFRLVELPSGEIVAEDSEGNLYHIEGDPEDNPELTY